MTTALAPAPPAGHHIHIGMGVAWCDCGAHFPDTGPATETLGDQFRRLAHEHLDALEHGEQGGLW